MLNYLASKQWENVNTNILQPLLYDISVFSLYFRRFRGLFKMLFVEFVSKNEKTQLKIFVLNTHCTIIVLLISLICHSIQPQPYQVYDNGV